MEQLTQLLFYVGLLTLGVNVVTEVINKVFTLKDGTHAGEIVCFVVSVILTIVSVIVYCGVNNITISFYIIAGAIFGSFFVAYASMFGYDKLKELIGKYINE